MMTEIKTIKNQLSSLKTWNRFCSNFII